MGEVYRARDPKLDREIALKVLSAELASSNEHLRRFEHEARAASALNHPNIVSIYDVGRDDEHAYIAMELVDGQDLRDMTARGPIPLKQLVRIAAKLTDGLAAAHERGIVHRDLKPENVIVSNEGFVKILDFGLAKLVRTIGQNDTTMPHTVPGAVFGTVGYMSPEQASGKPIDFRSDQFSIGVILYELLTGRRPFDEPSPAETMAAIIRNDPKPLRDLRADVPRDLDRIITRCLEKDPRDRYASTRDLARDLREVRNMITAPSGVERTSTARPRFFTRPKRRAGAMVAIGIALLVVIIASRAARKAAPAAPPAANVKAIGVLPFRDLTGTPDGQHFADGIAETVISRLAQSTTIRVAPLTGVTTNRSLKEIASRHEADRVVRGSVQRAGDQVRVTYAIVDPSTGEESGSNALTANVAEIFQLEDDLADQILQTLRVAHNASAPRRAASTGLTRAGDQATYLEAVGLLSTTKDLQSIDLAIAKLQSILPNARDSAVVNAQLSRALLAKYGITRQSNLVDTATLYAERAAHFDEQSPEVQLALGNAQLTTGQAAAAVASFERVIALRPNSAEAYASLGQAQETLGHAADAERAYQQTIALRPDWWAGFNKYGALCMTHGRFAEAEKYFRRVIDLQPDSARGYANLGGALQELGRYDDAFGEYQRALAISPSAQSFSNLGTIDLLRGRYDEASRAFEQATVLSPNSYEIWINLGDAYRFADRTTDAARAYDRAIVTARAALTVNAGSALARATIASSLAKTGHNDEAASEIRAALAIDPTNAYVLYDASVIAQLKGDTAAALDWLRQAVQYGLSPADAAADPDLRPLKQRPEFNDIVNRKT
jgi:serine/threonine-protein kinase